MTEHDIDLLEAITFYELNYEFIMEPLYLRPDSDKIILGSKYNQICRFCGLSKPEVSFNSKAHTIPESLGNKSIFSNYECDSCNSSFGQCIENDFGNWTKPYRTFFRIRGKKGVPTLKKGGSDKMSKVVYGPTGFHITQYEDNPICVINEEKKQILFKLTHDPFTPVAVLKSFVKMGLTLMPTTELSNFIETLDWVCKQDHTKRFVSEFPIFRTFQPGPMPNDIIVAMLMRRKDAVTDLPYAFMILSFGNFVFQVFLPSQTKDIAINRRQLKFIPFPVPGHLEGLNYSKPVVKVLDLCGRGVVRGEKLQITLGSDQVEFIDH